MLRYADLPLILRQVLMMLVFLLMIPAAMRVAVEKSWRRILSIILIIMAYLNLQPMIMIQRVLENIRKAEEFPEFLMSIPAWVILGVTLGIIVDLALLFFVKQPTELPHLRFSSLKVRVHDSFGGSIVAAKAYLSGGGTISREEVLSTFLSCEGAVLGKEKEDEDPIAEMNRLARLMGITLTIDGELPKNMDRRRTLALAVHECMTNTRRHAWGDSVFVVISDHEVEITNNGQQPKSEIRETGGLLHLRQLLEA